jgi:hypothetical protein
MQDAESAVLYLANVDRVREFRMRHWNFTKEYILKHTSHPVATGGSPIVTWLPNQLASVLKVRCCNRFARYWEFFELLTEFDSVCLPGFMALAARKSLLFVAFVVHAAGYTRARCV